MDIYWHCKCKHPEHGHVGGTGCIYNVGHRQKYVRCPCNKEPTFLCGEESHHGKKCYLMFLHEGAHTAGDGVSWIWDLSKDEYVEAHTVEAIADLRTWF